MSSFLNVASFLMLKNVRLATSFFSLRQKIRDRGVLFLPFFLFFFPVQNEFYLWLPASQVITALIELILYYFGIPPWAKWDKICGDGDHLFTDKKIPTHDNNHNPHRVGHLSDKKKSTESKEWSGKKKQIKWNVKHQK